MNSPNEAIAKACCADLYQSEWAQLILGETLHPGGLALTNRLGQLMGLKRGDRVADLASGRGASALAVSRAFHCQVIGVEFGRDAATQAYQSSRDAPVPSEAWFVQGDAETPPLKPSYFDAVFSECSMSIFMDKSGAVREVRNLLRPGGKFGLSDVTVEPGSLPSELEGTVGQVLCLANALPVGGYVGLLEEGDLHVTQQEDASGEILKLLDELDGKLGVMAAWQSFNADDAGESQTTLDMLAAAPDLISELRGLVTQGKLGYWLFVAQKPD